MTEHPDQLLLILMGLPASGKTTYAMSWVAEDPDNRVRLNYDDVRLELYGPDWKFNHPEEQFMKALVGKRAEEALVAGKSVVIDNTNLTTGVRKRWEDLARSLGVTHETYEIDTPVAECVRRDRLREGRARVRQAVIDRMALTTGWIDWNDRTVYPNDFIIVDLDGTVADCSARLVKLGPHMRHKMDCSYYVDAWPYCQECGAVWKKDWDAFFDGVEHDEPIEPILDLVKTLYGGEWGPDILIVSGRPIDKAGKVTEDWLLKHFPVKWRHLFMRNGGDHRPDVEVKQEILDYLPKDRIRYVLDDRDQVVDMWRKNGLTCLQVAEGTF